MSTQHDPDASGERHDRGGGDNCLIDPGIVNSVQGETAARHALKVSKPPPIKSVKLPKKNERRKT